MLKKVREFLFQNKTAKQTVAKNTFWLSVSNYGGRLVKMAIIIYGARVLDAAGYGVFSYALTLAGFLSLFLDPGINSILLREASKGSDEERMSVFATTFVLKVGLVLFGIFIVIFAGPFFSTLPGAAALLPLVALILSFDTFRVFFLSLVDAQEKMQWDAGITLLTNAAITILGFIFLLESPTAQAFTWAYAIGTGIGASAAFFLTLPYLKRSIPHFSKNLVGPILKAAWPFAVIGALGILLTNTDVLIISWIRTAAEVGVYSGVIRIVQAIYIIPGIIQGSTLPAFSRLAKSEPERFRASFERILTFIFLASVPLAFGGVVLGAQVMTLIFGPTFALGGNALKVLMASMVFDFPASVIGAAVFAYNHQKGLIISSAIAGAANVAFDLLLIPHFGMTGSAFATLFAQALSNWYLWNMMNRINRFSIIPRLGKIAIAGVVMALVATTLFVLHAEVLLNVVVCAVVYFAMLWALREPLLMEIKGLMKFAPTTVL